MSARSCQGRVIPRLDRGIQSLSACLRFFAKLPQKGKGMDSLSTQGMTTEGEPTGHDSFTALRCAQGKGKIQKANAKIQKAIKRDLSLRLRMTRGWWLQASKMCPGPVWLFILSVVTK